MVNRNAPNEGVQHLPITLQEQGSLALYLQIKYQLVYLISTQKLLAGARLPSIRQLSEHLKVNTRTVGQAYKELKAEGIISSSRGQGPFVQMFSQNEASNAGRHQRLGEILEAAYSQALALGFSPEAVVQRFVLASNEVPRRIPVAFIDDVPRVVDNYLGRLNHHFGNQVRPIGISLLDLEVGNAEALAAVHETFYLLVFARNVPRLQRVLQHRLDSANIVPVTAELRAEVVERLRGAASSGRVVLLSQERFLHAILAALADQCELQPKDVVAFTTTEVDDFKEAAAGASLIVHTVAAKEIVEAAGVTAPLLELDYDFSPDVLYRLRNVFA